MLDPNHQCTKDCYDFVIKARMHKKHPTAARQQPNAVASHLLEVIEEAGPELYVCDNQHDMETTYALDKDIEIEIEGASQHVCGYCDKTVELHHEGWFHDHERGGEMCPGSGRRS